MAKTIKKWTIRLTVVGLLLLTVFITLVLNPSLLYANKTSFGNFNIFHNSPIDSILVVRLNEANEIIKQSELFDANLKYDICLNDGSPYPALIKTILDEPIGTTFYNKIVFLGTISFKENYGLEGKNKWNMTDLIAHSLTHCLQFKKQGLWKSNPVADYPMWKWEGYAEYTSRNRINKNDLITNIGMLLKTEKSDNKNWIEFSDGTGSTLTFYKRRLLVQFCTEVEKMNFEQLLKDTETQEMKTRKMMSWYANIIDNNTVD